MDMPHLVEIRAPVQESPVQDVSDLEVPAGLSALDCLGIALDEVNRILWMPITVPYNIVLWLADITEIHPTGI